MAYSREISTISNQKLGIPSRDKIPIMEWDKGMYEITSEEELNILKSLPTEHKERRETFQEESSEDLTRDSISFEQRISFQPHDSRSSSSPSLSLLPRVRSSSLISQEHAVSSYLDDSFDTQSRKSMKTSRFFSKFKKMSKLLPKEHVKHKTPTSAFLESATLSDKRESGKVTIHFYEDIVSFFSFPASIMSHYEKICREGR